MSRRRVSAELAVARQRSAPAANRQARGARESGFFCDELTHSSLGLQLRSNKAMVEHELPHELPHLLVLLIVHRTDSYTSFSLRGTVGGDSRVRVGVRVSIRVGVRVSVPARTASAAVSFCRSVYFVRRSPFFARVQLRSCAVDLLPARHFVWPPPPGIRGPNAASSAPEVFNPRGGQNAAQA